LIIIPNFWKVKYFVQFCGIIHIMKESFGKRLKDLRKERGLTLVELANEVNIGKSIISLWEQDKCQPSLDKVIALADFFDVSLDYLAGRRDY